VSASAWVLLGTLLATPALAHDVRPGVVALQEVEPGAWVVRLTPPEDGGRPRPLLPVWPDGCSEAAPGLRCTDGLQGRVGFPGLAGRGTTVVLHQRHLDGRVRSAVLRPGEQELTLGGGGFGDHVTLGVQHLADGFDHQLFVLGLALVARSRGALFCAVTAFTLAHSLTLALAALGWLVVPRSSVELLIAASILLLAREAATGSAGLTARHPGVVAGLCGLLHGLGFAGALRELDLPSQALLPAVAGFNLGLELGQLGLLAVAGAALALARRGSVVPDRRVLAYAIGLPAAVWTVERWVAFVG
jgi:hypothetical protein